MKAWKIVLAAFLLIAAPAGAQEAEENYPAIVAEVYTLAVKVADLTLEELALYYPPDFSPYISDNFYMYPIRVHSRKEPFFFFVSMSDTGKAEYISVQFDKPAEHLPEILSAIKNFCNAVYGKPVTSDPEDPLWMASGPGRAITEISYSLGGLNFVTRHHPFYSTRYKD